MSKIIIIVIIVILGGGLFLLFKNVFGKKELKSTPDTLVSSVMKVQSPSSIPIPTSNPTSIPVIPVPTKFEYTLDLNKELESVNPDVSDSDFDVLNTLLNTF